MDPVQPYSSTSRAKSSSKRQTAMHSSTKTFSDNDGLNDLRLFVDRIRLVILRDRLALRDDSERDESGAAPAALQSHLRAVTLELAHTVSKDGEEVLRKVVNRGTRLCSHCGQSISLSRLKAIPYARRCIDCQRKFENGHADNF